MLNESVLERLSRSKQFGTVIGGSDLREMMSLEEQKAALGCEAKIAQQNSAARSVCH